MSTLEPPAGGKKPGGFALWLARQQMAHGRKLVIALPYLWLILLFLLPFLIVFKISLAEMARAIPPYTESTVVGRRSTDVDAQPRQLPAVDRRSAVL